MSSEWATLFASGGSRSTVPATAAMGLSPKSSLAVAVRGILDVAADQPEDRRTQVEEPLPYPPGRPTISRNSTIGAHGRTRAANCREVRLQHAEPVEAGDREDVEHERQHLDERQRREPRRPSTRSGRRPPARWNQPRRRAQAPSGRTAVTSISTRVHTDWERNFLGLIPRRRLKAVLNANGSAYPTALATSATLRSGSDNSSSAVYIRHSVR